VAKSPLTEFGATCIYPQIPAIAPYHNNAIWPFVQSYWNLAAAKAGNEKVLEHGLASLYRAAGLFLTNYENMVAGTGDFMGTEINSDRMLWSMAGNLAMVHRVFMGMEFETDRLLFSPTIPKAYKGKRSLKKFHYRNAILDITVEGYGNRIAFAEIDGIKQEKAFVPGTLAGTHSVYIRMADNDFSKDGIHLVDNAFAPVNPTVVVTGNVLKWKADSEASSFNIYQNGQLLTTIKGNTFTIPDSKYSEYSISAMGKNGFESFISEPVIYSKSQPLLIEAETAAAKSNLKYVNFSGDGFVEITKEKNTRLVFPLTVDAKGDYFIDIRYSNGSGPWNTDNKCAIRSLYANEEYAGVIVLPQRGTGEWSEWGYSNSRKVHLNKGKNELQLVFEAWNNNMNVDVNTAMIDQLRIYKAF